MVSLFSFYDAAIQQKVICLNATLHYLFRYLSLAHSQAHMKPKAARWYECFHQVFVRLFAWGCAPSDLLQCLISTMFPHTCVILYESTRNPCDLHWVCQHCLLVFLPSCICLRCVEKTLCGAFWIETVLCANKLDKWSREQATKLLAWQ